MNLHFETNLADSYKSQSQKIRVLSEAWVQREIYCPNCGYASINKYKNNNPASDFYCSICQENYELKSQKKHNLTKIIDGAYSSMINLIEQNRNPNLFILKYDSFNLVVSDLVVIPRHFFTSSIIEKRKELSQSARRKGWVGCNILVDKIPSEGKIPLVSDKISITKEIVESQWKKTLFLQKQNKDSKNWIIEIMNCINILNKQIFSIDEIYVFEGHLKCIFPYNQHIKAKIRQKLQILRDTQYLDFLGNGMYRLR